MGTKRFLTPEQEQDIVTRYSTGESALAISKTFIVSYQTVLNTLKRCGVAQRPELMKRRLNEQQRALIIETCLGGNTVEATAALFGTSPETVFRILKKAKVRLPKGRPRLYAVNDAAFDVLTPEVEYWMGFLWADGCVSFDGSTPRLHCVLGEKDRKHLEKLRAFVGSPERPIHRIEGKTALGGPFASFSLRSKPLCSALISRGFMKKRTRVPAFELATSRHFWRGAVDGDGWLGTSLYYKYLYPYIGLSGQASLIETFQNFLMTNNLARLEIDATESGIWKVSTSGTTAGDIIKKLYEGATVALDRKLARAQAIIAGDMSRSTPYIEEPGRPSIPLTEICNNDDDD